MDPDWTERESEMYGFHVSASMTELFSTTANTLDRIRDELTHGGAVIDHEDTDLAHARSPPSFL